MPIIDNTSSSKHYNKSSVELEENAPFDESVLNQEQISGGDQKFYVSAVVAEPKLSSPVNATEDEETRYDDDDDGEQVGSEKSNDNDEEEEIVHRMPSGHFSSLIQSFFTALKLHWRHELYEMFVLSWPILISNVCSSLLGTTDMAFVGRLGKDYLAAAALGNSLFHSAGFLAVGFISAQDTLISQATGAKNERMKRVVLQRSILIVSSIAFLTSIVLFFLDSILILVGQDKDLARLTGRFVRLNLIGLWPYCMIRVLTRFLTAQRYIHYPMINSVLSVGLNAFMNLLLIRGIGFKGMGFDGAPLATSITRIFILISLFFYTIYVERRKHLNSLSETTNESNDNNDDSGSESSPVPPIRWYSLSNIWKIVKTVVRDTVDPRGLYEYIKIGVPAASALCMEIWGFHVTTVLTGYLGSSVFVSAHSIVQNVCIITFMLPLAMATSLSIRVGISIGAGEPEKAKVASFIGFLLSLLIMLGTAILMIATKDIMGKLFTSDAQVIATVSTTVVLAAVYQIFDGVQVAFGGVLRGTGRQSIGAVANFIAYYVIGLPVGLFFCFYLKWKLNGLWFGLLMGVIVVSALLVVYMILRMDFYSEVEKARERVRRSDVRDDRYSKEETSPSDEVDVEL